MIKTFKNIKLIIFTSIFCIFLGILTFFTFINQSFIELNDLNLQTLLIVDLLLVVFFFILIIRETIKIIYQRKKDEVGSRTSLRYIRFFSLSTLLPSLLIAIFSLTILDVGLQKYFDKKIRSAVNNSYDVAKNYVEETRNAIESDILLMVIDINRNSNLFYDNKKGFKNVLKSQRLLRKLDEVYLLDSGGNIIFSDLIDISKTFVPPPDDAFNKSLTGNPIRITDAITNRTSALIKLSNFIDTYLYIVKFMDPKVIGYLKDTEQAINFYYSVENSKTGIKFTFGLIYLVVVSLLLFLSVVIAINFASRLTQPIVNLIGASEKISSGDLNAKVPIIESDSELEKLNENFNFMIEKLKKQQDKLLISERYSAWENVARKLAHEIKNPLTPIQLSIDRIREKYLDKINEDKDKDNFLNYLKMINKQIKDIEKLVNEFSDFARMPKPVYKRVDLNKIIIRSLNLYELSEPNIKFNFLKEKSSFYFKADEEQLNRVFINLIKNSIESINEKKLKLPDFKGKIDIDIKSDNDYIYFTMTDNGIGFKGTNKEKMLSPYFTTKKKGTGLGLAVVMKIINDHGGSLNFESVKNGAKILITIPKIQ